MPTPRGVRWSAVALRLRADARSHWLAWLLLGALTGLLAGAVVASFAAARRVDSVYDRFVAATNGFDALVTAKCDAAATNCLLPADAADRLLALDGVVDAVPVRFSVQPELLRSDGTSLHPSEDSCAEGAGQVLLMSSPDGRFGTEINRVLLLEGRLPSGPHEVAVSEPLARRGGLVLGDRIIAYPGPCGAGQLAANRTELRVVGIGLASGEVQPEQGFYYAGVHGTTALSDRLVALGGPHTIGFALLLREEATAAEIVAAAGQRGLELELGLDQHEIAAGVNRGLDPEEGSLAILFLVGSIAIIALLGPVIGRHARVALSEAPRLQALGATRREIVAIGGGHGLAIALIAAPLVIAVVLGSSWFTPPGRASLIEPDPGPRLDVLLVGLALVAVVALVVGCAGIAAGTAARRQRPPAPVGATLASRLGSWTRLPPSAVAGTRLALEPRLGAARVPVRSGLLGVILGVATITGVLVYLAGFDHLRSSPRLIGWNWDSLIGWGNDDIPDVRTADATQAAARATAGVRRASLGTIWSQPTEGIGPALLRAGDREEPTFLLSFSSGPGAVVPVMTSGRTPAGPTEIAVDRAMLELLDVEVGSAVAVVTQSGAHDFLVVGTTVLPIDRTDALAGRSGVITFEGFLALLPAAQPEFLAVDLDDGVPPYELVDSLRQAGFRVGQGRDSGSSIRRSWCRARSATASSSPLSLGR